MNIFERYLTLWVLLCIVAGIALGELFPAVFQQIARMEVAAVNIPVGLLIWVMIVPMLIRVDFGALLATLVLLFAFQAGPSSPTGSTASSANRTMSPGRLR